MAAYYIAVHVFPRRFLDDPIAPLNWDVQVISRLFFLQTCHDEKKEKYRIGSWKARLVEEFMDIDQPHQTIQQLCLRLSDSFFRLQLGHP